MNLGEVLQHMRVMTLKELIQFRRDIFLLIVVLYAFSADIYIAGSGIEMELKQAALTVADYDQSPASRDLIYSFRQPQFKYQGMEMSADRAMDLLDAGKTMLYLEIPPDFNEALLSGKPTQVQLFVDTSNSVLGSLATSYAAQIVAGFGIQKAMERLSVGGAMGGGLPMVNSAHRVWFNPNGSDRWFVPINEMITMITMLSIMLPAAAMVREKERGTVEQLLVSPLTPLEIMLPKVLAMTFVILIGVTLAVYGVLGPVFEIPFRGNMLLFYVLTAIYVFSTAGFGLAISTVVNNLAQVGLMVIMLLSPMLLLSGAFVPPEAMPTVLGYLILLSPMHHYIEIVMGIFLKGVGLDVLWPSVLGLLLVGAGVFAFGTWRFRRQFG
ncbi:MAG TPA: ABC transporter permease [Candidatus Acidoferrales bacterium]|nr:ABC transporter permease [Candidatus Acidoferrales bacterium]